MNFYGKDKVGKLTFIKEIEIQLSNIEEEYESILVILEEEYCYGVCKLVHNRNHHVILDVTIEEKGYYILSNDNDDNGFYKICIMKENKIMKHLISKNK